MSIACSSTRVRRRGRAGPGAAPTPMVLAVLAVLAAQPAPAPAQVALPALRPGGVVAGAATPVAAGTTMTITQTAPRGVIEWNHFNIGAGGTVAITQPGADAVLLNRVIGNSAGSRIDGTLTANGRIFILDPGGLSFGRGATVQVGSLVAAAMDYNPGDGYAGFLAGNDTLVLDANPGQAELIVEPGASLSARAGGHLVMLGSGAVSLGGSLVAPQGSIVLGAGGRTTVPVGRSGFVTLNLEPMTAAAAAAYTPPSLDTQALSQASAASIQMLAAGEPLLPAEGPLEVPRIRVAGPTTVTDSGTLQIDAGPGGDLLVLADLRAEAVAETAAFNRGGDITLSGDTITLAAPDANTGLRVSVDGRGGGGTLTLGGSNTRALRIEPGVTLSADATQSGFGGSISVLATFFDAGATGVLQPREDFGVAEIYGTLQARGGPFFGNGGTIETLAPALTLRLQDPDGALQVGRVEAGAPSSAFGGGIAGIWRFSAPSLRVDRNTPVAAGGVFLPAAPGAAVHADDLAQALGSGTSVSLDTTLSGAPQDLAGDILVAAGVEVDSIATRPVRLALRAGGGILMDSGSAFTASGSPLDVDLIADARSAGFGRIELRGIDGEAPVRIATAGGAVRLAGGPDGLVPAPGGSDRSGIQLRGTEIDTTVLAGDGIVAGDITLRGSTEDGEGAVPGVHITQSLLRGRDLVVFGRSQSGQGVWVEASTLVAATPVGGIDIRGIATGNAQNPDLATPTGVRFSDARLQLDGGTLRVIGRAGGADGSVLPDGIGIEFANTGGPTTIEASASSTAVFSLAGVAEAPVGRGLASGPGSSFSLTGPQGGSTGASLALGGMTGGEGGNGSVFALEADPQVLTTGAVNLRPLSAADDGALTEATNAVIRIGRSGEGGGVDPAFTVPANWLLDGNLDLAAAPFAAAGLVIGSSGHQGLITLGADVLDAESMRLTLQNQGSAAAGIVLEGNSQAAVQLALMSAGAITQSGPIAVQRLFIKSESADVTLSNAANRIDAIAFDPPATLIVVSAGNLSVDSLDADSFLVDGNPPGSGSFTTQGIATSQAIDRVLLQAGPGAAVTLTQGIAMSGAGSQLDIVSPTGLNNAGNADLVNGPGGRWQVWSQSWETEQRGRLAGTGATPNLFGCDFGGAATCSVSGVAIPAGDSGFRYASRPEVTITPQAVSFVQGQAVPAIGFTASGLVLGDSAASLAGALGTTADSSSTPGTYRVTAGTLASPQGYSVLLASGAGVLDVVTVTAATSLPVTPPAGPTLGADLVPGQGLARAADWPRLALESSSEVNGRNLSRAPMCQAPGSMRRLFEPGDASEDADPLGLEWTRVRNQPHLSSCLEASSEAACSAF